MRAGAVDHGDKLCLTNTSGFVPARESDFCQHPLDAGFPVAILQAALPSLPQGIILTTFQMQGQRQIGPGVRRHRAGNDSLPEIVD